MPFRVVVGAGATGTATALLLAESGDSVALVSRRGTGPDHAGVTPVAADATDSAALARLARGATTVFNCAMPAYDRWPTAFPPLATSVLTAAESVGADYVLLGNAYGYGYVNGPYTEHLPMAPNSVKGKVRAEMWHEALTAHNEGRIRVMEVRASDFLGAGAASMYALASQPLVLAGRSVGYPADLDVPHSWTYVGDAARTMVGLVGHPEAWGRAWHVPSTPLSVRELTEKLAAAAEVAQPVLDRVTADQLAELGQTDPIMNEIVEMLYMEENPFILDSSGTQQLLGFEPTPLEDVVAEIVAAHRARS
jgi:nucleoside-diphosphate-sugar epimerase